VEIRAAFGFQAPPGVQRAGFRGKASAVWAAVSESTRGYGSRPMPASSSSRSLQAELIFFEPSGKSSSYRPLQVGNPLPYAYPVVSGNRIYVKDKDAVSCVRWIKN